ncbi:MAG: dual specificity protein phosphatase family protein [Staphylothermus sp.]|nr:dual specificity protein phosphatase family protein [Staphylothermus sp.]
MIYVWIIENKLAQGPFPSYSLLSDYAKVFDAFVVLVMPHEIPGGSDYYYLELLNSCGLEVYYAPTPDLHPVDLLVLHDISLFIDYIVNKKVGKVFVHCMGGIGRSGTVTTAYLIYSGKSLYDSISIVRSKVPGAVEVFGQWKILEDYYALHRNTNKTILNFIPKFYKTYLNKNNLKHLSKVIQLSIELAEALDINLQYDDLVLTTSLYGVLQENENKIEIFEKNLGISIDENIIQNANVLSKKIHLDDIDLNKLDDHVLLMYLSKILDYYHDQRVVVTDHSIVGDEIVVTLYCDYSCSKIIETSYPIIREFEKRIGKRVSLIEQSYLESI